MIIRIILPRTANNVLRKKKIKVKLSHKMNVDNLHNSYNYLFIF